MDLMTLVRRIESRYDSVNNAPEDDPDYIALRKLYPIKTKASSNKDDEIIRLADFGYSQNYITAKVHKDAGYVSNLLKVNRIELKPTFSYGLASPNHTKVYTTSLIHFVQVVYTEKFNTSSEAKAFLMARGYRVRKVKKVWVNIKNGDYYLHTRMTVPEVKDGIDSYVYEN